MAEQELKVSFSSTLFENQETLNKEEKKERISGQKVIHTKIKKYVCALLNSRYGGKLNITAHDDGVINADDIIRPVEQFFQKMISADHLSNKMFISYQTRSQIIYTVKPYDKLCTFNYNVYLATSTQLLLVTPLQVDTVKGILDIDRFETTGIDTSRQVSFVRGRAIGIKESNTVQFKLLKTNKTSGNNLASRMINNRLHEYVSAFANQRGGCLYYGIGDDGTVEGEEVTENDKGDVLGKLQNLKSMRWPECIGKPRQGNEWDIEYMQVMDETGNTISSVFVIVISIKSCPGGVFCKDPESYHIIEGEVKPMKFADWKREFLYPKGETTISRRMSKCDWSSSEMKAYCDVLDGSLLRLINNGDHDDFRKAVEAEIKSKPMDIEVNLVLLSKWYVFHYRQGHFKEAAKCLAEYKNNVPKAKDTLIFETRGQLVESALERTRGKHKKGYEIAKESLGKVDQISPCMLTVEFYVHFATMLTIIEGNKELKEDKDMKQALVEDNFKDEAILFYNKALEHLRETDYVPQSKADMEQKTRINLAILKLGCSLSGDVVDDVVRKDDIKAASTNLELVNTMIVKQCNPLSSFRECHLKFAMSSLFYRRAQHENDSKRRIELLKSAKREVKYVGLLATDNKFKELSIYAKKHTLVYDEQLKQEDKK